MNVCADYTYNKVRVGRVPVKRWMLPVILLLSVAAAQGCQKKKGESALRRNAVKTTTGYDMSGGIPQPIHKTEYTYDALNHLSEEVHYEWQGNRWSEQDKWEYTYDADNRLDQEIWYKWSGTGWEKNRRTLYIRDSNGVLQVELEQRWNGSAWEDSDRTVYEYDQNGKLIKETHQEYWGGNWQNDERYDYEYDSNGRLIRQVFCSWNSIAQAWDTEEMNEYQYSGGKLSEITYYYYQNSSWIQDGKDTISWDGNHICAFTYYDYDSQNQLWVLSEKTEIQFSGGYPQTFNYYDYSGSGYDWRVEIEMLSLPGCVVLPDDSLADPFRYEQNIYYGEELNRYLGK